MSEFNELSSVDCGALVKRLYRLGAYRIKSSSIGWWVDGCCGYCVSSRYFATKREALVDALINIKRAKEEGRNFAWRYQ